MNPFIVVMLLVCQMKAGSMQCYDHGVKHLRKTDVQTKDVFEYYKCTNDQYKSCDTLVKWDGCKFVLKDKSVLYSSYTCDQN